MQLTDDELSAIAADLALCELGEATTKGRLRARYRAHAKACRAALADDMAAFKATPEGQQIDAMTDDELLAELQS